MSDKYQSEKYKKEVMERVARNHFRIYDLNGTKDHQVKITGRVLKSVLDSVYEAGRYAKTDTYAEALKIAMAPPRKPFK